MSGAGLIGIKRRIKSITNTKKITKAMGLVATSKLRKTREMLNINEKYNDSFNEIINNLLNVLEEPTLYQGNKSDKKLFIALTSDTGLCGGYNNSIVSATIEQIKGNFENSQLMIVGQKGRTQFKKLRYETVAEYVELPTLPEIKDANTIAQHALAMYEKGQVGEVYVVYYKFHSAVKQTVEVEKLLPLEKNNNGKVANYIGVEPSAEVLQEKMIISYLKQRMFNLMLNSKTSEQSSRMEAMNGATQNANDILEKLHLKFNRLRQSSITQEISEIVGGATAQK